jgi:hypothetical protein
VVSFGLRDGRDPHDQIGRRDHVAGLEGTRQPPALDAPAVELAE